MLFRSVGAEAGGALADAAGEDEGCEGEVREEGREVRGDVEEESVEVCMWR